MEILCWMEYSVVKQYSMLSDSMLCYQLGCPSPWFRPFGPRCWTIKVSTFWWGSPHHWSRSKPILSVVLSTHTLTFFSQLPCCEKMASSNVQCVISSSSYFKVLHPKGESARVICHLQRSSFSSSSGRMWFLTVKWIARVEMQNLNQELLHQKVSVTDHQ